MPAVIRRLGPADVALGWRLVHDLKRGAVSESYVARLLGAPANFLFAALAGETPVGFLLAHRLDRLPEERPHFFIYELEVAERFRRQGLGRGLIEALLTEARREDAAAFVIALASNQAALRLYAATGAEVKEKGSVVLLYPRAATPAGSGGC